MDRNDINDLISRQEYIKYIYKDGTPISTVNNRFYSKSYQVIVKNFASLHSNIRRLIVKFDPGAGKTYTSLLSAINWIEAKRALGIMTSRIIVIGFTKKIFIKELLSLPQLGFITEAEMDAIKEKEQLYKARLIPKQDYKQFLAGFKGRISNAAIGGYFRFIGYKELANDLFNLSDAENIDVQEGLRNNTLNINTNLLSMFADAFVIIDEFHKLYNSRAINTYGIAVKYILDKYRDIKVLMLSATPLTNSPREIVDLLNIITGSNYSDRDFFDKESPLPDAIARIKELLRGYVCYVRSENPELYPSKSFVGDTIEGIPYLRFIRSKISKEHARILKAKPSLQIEDQPLMDYILPGPDGYIYKTSDINDVYESDWAYQNKFRVKSSDGYMHIRGIDLSVCSAKYLAMLDILKNSRGKVLIFHPRISGPGVIFISDVLRDAGYIAHDEIAAKNTLCMTCGKVLHQMTDHKFIPAKFVLIHGELGKNVMEELLDMYNSPENTFGEICQICIGSEVITESVNFKAIQTEIIAGIVESSGALIQVMGRSVRLGSHRGLPANMCHVNIYILTSATGNGLSPEEERYSQMMQRYKTIQKIDRALHEGALDAVMNYPLISKGLEDNINVLRYKADYDVPRKVEYGQFYKYYIDQEVRELAEAIKIMFRVYSRVWTLEDLWEGLHMVDINFEINIDKVTYDAFILAIDYLTRGPNLPIREQPVFYIGNIAYSLINIESANMRLLIAAPCYTKQTFIGTDTSLYNYSLNIDSWYRTPMTSMRDLIPIDEHLKVSRISPAEARETFLNGAAREDELGVINMLNELDEDFHIHMIKYCIAYVFNVLTNHSIPLVEFHHTIVRLLHIYSMLGYILFASDLETYFDEYKDYISSDSVGHGYDNMLVSISRALETSVLFSMERFNELMGSSKRMPDSAVHDIIKKKAKIVQVAADILPVAFSISTASTYQYSLYEPKTDTWITKFEPLYVIIADENDIIVGYDIDMAGVLGKVFKTRKPVTSVADKRLLNKGMNCATYKKERLDEILAALGITSDETKIKGMCTDIKRELIRREVESRRRGDNVKWFYFSFEYNPLKH